MNYCGEKQRVHGSEERYMGKLLTWLAIVVVAVAAIGTMIGVDEDTVVFLGEIIVLAVILFVLVAGIVADRLQDGSEEEPKTKPKKPISHSDRSSFWDDVEITQKDVEDLYINDLFWEAEKKRQQENNPKK